MAKIEQFLHDGAAAEPPAIESAENGWAEEPPETSTYACR